MPHLEFLLSTNKEFHVKSDKFAIAAKFPQNIHTNDISLHSTVKCSPSKREDKIWLNSRLFLQQTHNWWILRRTTQEIFTKWVYQEVFYKINEFLSLTQMTKGIKGKQIEASTHRHIAVVLLFNPQLTFNIRILAFLVKTSPIILSNHVFSLAWFTGS